MADTLPIPRELVERAPTLYSITGDIKDINTLLIPRSALTQQAEGATQDEIIELVAALEIRAILEHIKTVAAIYPVDDMPTPFQSAWRGCCEEIFFLATGCQWHMSQDDGRRRVQGDTAGQKIVERALATSATPPSPSAEPAMPCGHHPSLMLHSAETGEPLYCELCDDKSGRKDAELRETELAEANRVLREELAAQPSGEVLTDDQLRAGMPEWVSVAGPFREAFTLGARFAESATLAKIGAK